MNNETQHALAPAGVIDHGEGKVTFGLFAPFKKGASVIGDFNNWDKAATPMHLQEDGLWVAEVELSAGEHDYQFVVDSATENPLIIADPYSRKLRWADGQADPHSIVEVGKQAYSWGDANFGVKPLNQLVIYELHVGNFSPEGTFEGVTKRLDYIRDLGVNAIELMPIQEFPGDTSWGYNPAYFFCAEQSYGTADDFKILVDQAHQRGIAVILDIVFNHTDGSSPLNKLYPYDQNPYFGKDTNPWGFPDFNHWSDATKRFTRDVQYYWLTEFHVDAFRYDHSEGIGWDAENGLNFIAWSAKQTKPYAYLIAENLKDPSGTVKNTYVDASWHESFHWMVKAQLLESDYHGNAYGDIDGLLKEMTFSYDGYTDNAQAINYLENHDQERLAHEIRANPALNIDQAVTAKSKLGAIVLFTAQGVPMLYSGQEFGEQTPKTTDVSKLNWERLGDGVWADLHNFYATMCKLRTSQPALTKNNIETIMMDKDKKILVFKRWDKGGNQIVVGLNFAPIAQTVEVGFPRAGKWHEWILDYDEDLGKTPIKTVELPASGGKVWVAV